MTVAFDEFMRQHLMTGSEKADGYSANVFVGLGEEEKSIVLSLLLKELPWSAEWIDARQDATDARFSAAYSLLDSLHVRHNAEYERLLGHLRSEDSQLRAAAVAQLDQQFRS